MSAPKKSMTGVFALAFTSRVILLCFLPSAFFAYVGRWIDTRLGFSLPIATLVGLFLALYVVYLLMLREAKRYRTFFS